MSGGSWDYLCHKRIEDLINEVELVYKMWDRLTSDGYSDAAKQTYLIGNEIDKFKNRMQVLLDDIHSVWKAVEWYDSGDISIVDLHKAAGTWSRGKNNE